MAGNTLCCATIHITSNRSKSIATIAKTHSSALCFSLSKNSKNSLEILPLPCLSFMFSLLYSGGYTITHTTATINKIMSRAANAIIRFFSLFFCSSISLAPPAGWRLFVRHFAIVFPFTLLYYRAFAAATAFPHFLAASLASILPLLFPLPFQRFMQIMSCVEYPASSTRMPSREFLACTIFPVFVDTIDT